MTSLDTRGERAVQRSPIPIAAREASSRGLERGLSRDGAPGVSPLSAFALGAITENIAGSDRRPRRQAFAAVFEAPRRVAAWDAGALWCASSRSSVALEMTLGAFMTARRNPHITGPRIDPPAITGKESAADLVDQAFLAYNGARLREGARLLNERMLADDVTVALSVTGALTPAGLGMSAIIPLMQAGFVDWIVSTGANLYHDTHFGIGLSMHAGTWQADDVELREKGVVRIYDVFFDYSVLLDTDAFFREIISGPEFQRTMSTAEFHNLCGKYVRAREEALGLSHRSQIGRAHV